MFGSGVNTALYANDDDFIKKLSLNPERQIIGSQCSGALFLDRLSLQSEIISTDTMTAPKLLEKGVKVSSEPLYAEGNVASAGGCFSSYYLAAWAITKAADWQTAKEIIHYIAPIGQKDRYVNMTEEVVLSVVNH